ncbi:MAG: type II toxin-antitoxin system VapC family toxin [Actinobacteria bacterium]|nr:type II toxin-antitoxin system VapC family toxin [Actinomycetota bacterium]
MYFDTSGLLKLFVDEMHTEETRNWARAADAIALSRVTLPEASSAISRRQRTGGLTLTSARQLVRKIAAFSCAATVLELDEVRAADLAFEHGLRGFDAIQLAAALSARDNAGAESFAFASFDLALNRAARAEGLTVLEPLD